MDAGMMITALVPVLSVLISVIGACLRERERRRRLSADLAALPPGSRVIDRGDQGVVVEIGGQSPAAPAAGDE